MGGTRKQSLQGDKVAQLAAGLRADGKPSQASNNVPQLLTCMRTEDLKVNYNTTARLTAQHPYTGEPMA